MTNRYAVASGNWSSLATWDGGASLPGVGDTVRPNGFVVAIDQTITVYELRHDAGSPAAANGYFDLTTTGVTINARIYPAGTTYLLRWSSNTSITVNGDTFYGGNGGYAINSTGNGNLVWNGNIAGGVNANMINHAGIGAITINGIPSSGYNNNAIYQTAGTITINGSNNQTTSGAMVAGGGIVSVSGGSLIWNGNPSGWKDSAAGGYALIISGGTALINGSPFGALNYGAIYCSGGVVSIVGDITAGSTPAVTGTSAGTVYHISGNIVAGSTGAPGSVHPKLLIHPTNPCVHVYRTYSAGSAGVARSLYTGGTNLGQPVIADVREATVFGASSEYTGTLAVPSPTLVAIGVDTDNTVGSYAPSSGLDAAGVRAAVGLATANLDTQLAAIVTDTNDLQTNQGAWATAVGFATPTNITAGTITTVTNLTNLPAGVQTSIDTVQAIAAGTVTGAGTATEVFVGTNATVTVTADSSGNRSAVVVT